MNVFGKALLVLGVSMLFISASTYRDARAAEIRRSDDPEVLNIYLDCQNVWCDFSYIRREVAFVNYVRNPQDADVHVLVTAQGTGSGGRRITLSLLGQRGFDGRNDELTFTTGADDTPDEQRERLVHHLKIGLVPFVANTSVAGAIEIDYAGETEQTTERAPDERWNFWVFDFDMGGWFSLESKQTSYNVDGSVSANRITPQWRVRNHLSYQYDSDKYDLEETDLLSTSKETEYDGSVVYSLSSHWSTGVFGSYDSDTEINWRHSVAFAPGVEYNVFPYSESDRKELTFVYSMRGRAVEYRKETIFDETSELLSEHALNVRLRLTQPWGTAGFFLEGSHYLHDASKYSVDFWGRVSVRVAKGLSVRAQLGAERVRDQLYLPKGDATLEEILLRRRQLATNFDISGSVGFSYTFGSIYNNVVNNRM